MNTKKAKHTPGPKTGHFWNPSAKAKDKANAALIAAAPTMYDVLLEVEENSRLRLPIKKDTWLKVCEVLRTVDGIYR